MEQKYITKKRNRKINPLQRLITNSAYEGIWLDSIQCMDGYGVYIFPDGSQYQGYFNKGNFHGYGTLHLAKPYDFYFKGKFSEGHLVEIEDMWFDDGLSVSADINGWSMDFSCWPYCTEKDRRFFPELHPDVLHPSTLAAKEPECKLEKNYYDVKEGIYNPSTGLLTQRPAPFPKIAFVSCAKDIEWILNNCRHGPMVKIDISPDVFNKIVCNNFNSEREIQKRIPKDGYTEEKNSKNYFDKLCSSNGLDVEVPGDNSTYSENSAVFSLCSSSNFSISSMPVEAQKNRYLTDECERDTPAQNSNRDAVEMAEQNYTF